MRYRLKTTIKPDTERISRREEEAGCFGLLTNVPTTGHLAHSPRDILTVYKEQHGTEQHYGFLKDPVIVTKFLAACRREQSDSSLNGAWVKHWWPTPKAIARFGRLCTCHREFFRHQTS